MSYNDLLQQLASFSVPQVATQGNNILLTNANVPPPRPITNWVDLCHGEGYSQRQATAMTRVPVKPRIRRRRGETETEFYIRAGLNAHKRL